MLTIQVTPEHDKANYHVKLNKKLRDIKKQTSQPKTYGWEQTIKVGIKSIYVTFFTWKTRNGAGDTNFKT